jgi:hypothetical protein
MPNDLARLPSKSQKPNPKSQVTLNPEKIPKAKRSQLRRSPLVIMILEFTWDLEPGIWDFRSDGGG